MSTPQSQYILIDGNLLNGFVFYGPFASHQLAVIHARDSGYTPNVDIWIAPILPVPLSAKE